MYRTVLLEYFVGEEPLRLMSQISRNVDLLRSNYCVLARIVCIYQNLRFYCCELINPREVRICSMLAKHSSHTVYISEEDKKFSLKSASEGS